MVQRERSRDSLLFLMALAPCLCLAQTSNEGVVYVKPGSVLSTVAAFENKQGAQLNNDGELYVYSDFKNDGKVGFTAGSTSGITRFRGQKIGTFAISGAGSSEAYNVEFNNVNAQSGFELLNKLTVFGKADFQNGIIYSRGDNLLVFDKDAAAENADETSFVNGAVVKNGNKAFTFPVGDGSKFRPVSISAPSEAGAVFTGKYILKNPNTLYPAANVEASLDLINNAEYWEVKRTDAGVSAGNVVVTLKWDEATTPAALFAEPLENLHVTRWDDVKKVWVDLGGVADLAKKQVVTVSPLSSYGVFTLARVKKDVEPSKTVITSNPGISANGDGINDELVIQGLDAHPDNKLTVFDRFGRVVFETTAYNTKGNVFKGMVQNTNEVLPLGTYFYTIDYLDEATGRRVKKSNYLYINLK